LSDRPRVAFDLTPVISGRTGIARYTAQVQRALGGQPVVIQPFAVGRSAFGVPAGTRHVRIPARLLGAWWGTVPWPPIERLAGAADLVHATGLFFPATRLPLVITVHDLGALRHPELHPPRQVHQQRALLGRLREAAAILAVSGAAGEDVVSFGVPAERVVVSPLGLTPLPDPVEPARTGGSSPYLLTVGETAARKGYRVLLEALSQLGGELELVMVGPPGAEEERLQGVVASLGLGDRVHRLGAVSDGQLAALYRDALALCFPSITEGFGLPVLEAMAAGTPVLASDIPATRELAGDVAVYVNDRSADAWAQAIRALLAGPPGVAEAGRERAARFTWERTAGATMEAYRLALRASSD
jgi:glycosyltransferase involved in cell wall biosynthesis